MQEMMRRTVLVEPGRFAREDVPVPLPGPGEVLVRVSHVGVCGSDMSAYHGKHPYIHCPVVLGHEFSGTIVARGDDHCLPMGTRVAAIPHLVCGQCDACHHQRYNLCEHLRCIGAQADGAHAEYVVVPSPMTLALHDGISLAEAALVEPAAVSYHGLMRADVQAGDRVLVVGAGPIGAFAVQAAKALGAGAVYAADLDARRLELAAQLGADGIIDVSREPLSAGLARLAGGPTAIRLWVDCVGGNGAVLDQLIALAPRGSTVLVIGVLGHDYTMPHLPDFVEHELTLLGTTMYVPQDYRDVLDHIAEGVIRTAGMVSHTHPMDRIADVFAAIAAGDEWFFKVLFSADPLP